MDDDAEVFVACRERMALPELDGSSEAVLREHFSALVSVFLASATRSVSSGSPLLLARADFETMLHDCRLMQRVGANVLPKHVDAVWARLSAAGPTEPSKPPPLDMPRFLEALVLLSRAAAASPSDSVAVGSSASSAASTRPPPPTEPPSDRLQALLRPPAARGSRCCTPSSPRCASSSRASSPPRSSPRRAARQRPPRCATPSGRRRASRPRRSGDGSGSS